MVRNSCITRNILILGIDRNITWQQQKKESYDEIKNYLKPQTYFRIRNLYLYAAVNGKLELTLLKGRQRFDTVSTSNLKV